MKKLINKLYRFNRWLDKRETLKFILLIVYVLLGFGSFQFGNLIFGTIMISILCFITISRVFIIDGRLKFDRSEYCVPDVGEIVVIKKDFFYDGSFRKFINTSEPGRKPNWLEIRKGTEWIISGIKETDGDWKISMKDCWWEGIYDMNLYYLDTKDYWETKSDIRNNTLKKIGIN
jgi:hypothetical protein